MTCAEVKPRLAGLAFAFGLIEPNAVGDAPFPQFRVALPAQVMILVAVGLFAVEEVRQLVELPIELRRTPLQALGHRVIMHRKLVAGFANSIGQLASDTPAESYTRWI